MSQVILKGDLAASLKAQLKHCEQMGINMIPVKKRSSAGSKEKGPPDRIPEQFDERLAAVQTEIGVCTRCPLQSGRTNIVFGEGNPKATLMFVGEAPGADEDASGRPFVGRAGKLLTDMIEKGMGINRGDIYIANIVKCRPPGNRNPEPIEIETCIPFLKKQIAIINPKVIIALGKFAAQTLLQTETAITKLRGEFHEFEQVKVMPTYHPAYLLRNPIMKKAVWEDLQKVMKLLGIPLPKKV